MHSALEAFKERKAKAKDVFTIARITKNEAFEFVSKYHYLKDAKFFQVDGFGLFEKSSGNLVGVASYAQTQGIVALRSWFSLGNENTNIYELSRLCVLPSLNGTNATSYLLGNTLKILRKEGYVRAVTTLASSDRHVGSIYQVCNFTYYGLSDPKSDFFSVDGKCNARGKTADKAGVWLPRPRKHRYAYIFDKTLKCNYPEQDRPKLTDKTSVLCCGGVWS